MNLNLYGYGPPNARRWIAIDCGVTFGHEGTPGVEIMMPDPTFIVDRSSSLLALVLTHGHEDHIGAIPFLWPKLRCPVYAAPFTAALLKSKFEDVGLADEVPINVIGIGEKTKLGPFDFKLISVSHSVPESNAVALRTPLGTVLHTADWKLDPDPIIGRPTDEASLRSIGEEGVLAMVCDSTNVFNEGQSGSETQVQKSLADLIGNRKGRIAVTSFSSHLARLFSVAKIASAHDRRVVVVGRAIRRVLAAAIESGILSDMPPLLDEMEGGSLPRNKVLLFCTGSQGQSNSALNLISHGEHQRVVLERGDTVIVSSRVVPGNEREFTAMQNRLIERGVEVITDQKHFVHVSGHPSRDELASMYRWVRPQILIPVHGEIRHLVEHAKFSKSLNVPKTIVVTNGKMVRLAPEARIVDEVPAGRIYKDGTLLVPADARTVADRRRLGFAGAISVALALTEDGRLASDPSYDLIGIPERDRDGGFLHEAVHDAVIETFESLPRGRRRDSDAVAEAVRRAVRGTIADRWGKKPMCYVHVLEV